MTDLLKTIRFMLVLNWKYVPSVDTLYYTLYDLFICQSTSILCYETDISFCRFNIVESFFYIMNKNENFTLV